MARDFASIAQYLRAREKRGPQNTNLDVGGILRYVGLADEEEPIEVFVEQYIIANKIGLDCYKTMITDYMVNNLDKDYNVLDILEASLLVHDEYLFEKAIIAFLNRFHEITRSEKFQSFTRSKGIVTRLIIHSARVWVTNNGKFTLRF